MSPGFSIAGDLQKEAAMREFNAKNQTFSILDTGDSTRTETASLKLCRFQIILLLLCLTLP
jgi:hypothetical protein